MSFNRKTFDPFNDYHDRSYLNVLRGYGASRQPASSAMDQALRWHKRNKGQVTRFLDLGCGDSRDWLWAERDGYIASRVDLFPPDINFDPSRRDLNNFWQADIVERLPFAGGSFGIIICQAVIDLVEPESRIRVYEQAKCLLQPDGIFVCFAQPLAKGWGITPKDELATLRALFPTVVGYSNHWRCHMIPQSRYIQPDGTYNLEVK